MTHLLLVIAIWFLSGFLPGFILFWHFDGRPAKLSVREWILLTRLGLFGPGGMIIVLYILWKERR